MTQIVVVVLNYKTPELAVNAAYAAAQAMDVFDGAIVLVDNASPDDSFDAMKKGVVARDWPAHLQVHVLQSGHNGGFGAGNNYGMRAGLAMCPDADYFYVLNPDATPERDAIAALVNCLEANPKAAAAGSWITDEDGADICSAFRFPGVASEFEGAIRFGPVTKLLKNYTLPLHVPDKSGPVGWIVGASMLAKTSVLKEIGLFDETFFLYFDETDLCLRIQNAGYEVHFVRESRVPHIGSVSTGMKSWDRTPQFWFESRWHYYTKHYGRYYALAATTANVIGSGLWHLRNAIQRRPNTNTRRFTRDMIAHDTRAFFRPARDASIREMTALSDVKLQLNVE